MRKYPKVKRVTDDNMQKILSDPVAVVEKMDGANFRFTHGKNVDGVSDDRLVFGSRNVVWKNEKDVDKNFQHAIDHVRESVDAPIFENEVERGDDELTIYGEAMHCHTLTYGETEQRESGAATFADVPSVLIFDVHSEAEGWLSWQSVKHVARRLGLETVPEIYGHREYGSVDELPDNPESEYRDGVAEGIVLRRPGTGIEGLRAKHRSDEFLDKHRSARRSTSAENNQDDTTELAYKLLSKDNWVEKEIHRRRNAGKSVQMEDMEEIWRAVFDDIIEEEYETILLGNWDINTKKFRSIIASTTADEVRAYQERPDGSVLNEEQV
jgi:hypothetical protein